MAAIFVPTMTDNRTYLSGYQTIQTKKWRPFCFYDLITGPVNSRSKNKDGCHFILLFNIRTQICPDIDILRLLDPHFSLVIRQLVQ
jgi:hypothetical protein